MFLTAVLRKSLGDFIRELGGSASFMPRFVIIHNWPSAVMKNQADDFANLSLESFRFSLLGF